jgi:predicted dehydrogenase
VRYGVVGCGRAFQRLHLPVIAVSPGIEIVGICEPAPDGANGIPGHLQDIPCFPDVTTFLDRCRPDVVAVCTPNDAHADASIAALDRGLAVLCEKPLASSIDDARRMVAHATGDAVLAVNLPYRHSQLFGQFAEMAASYAAVDLQAEISTPGPRLWRPRTQWYRRREVAGGGALLDLGLHLLDPLELLLGPLEIVSCAVDDLTLEEVAEIELSFARGTGRVEICRAARTAKAALTVKEADGGRWCTLDLRHGELRTEAGLIAAADEVIEQTAIRAFLDSCAGSGGDYVSGARALTLQQLVTDAYLLAAPLSGMHLPAE